MAFNFLSLVFVCLYFVLNPSKCDFNPYEDSVLFRIDWAGSQLPTSTSEFENAIVMTTAENERYQCVMPKVLKQFEESLNEYDGPSAMELLKPLLMSDTCVLKIEAYWNYELCHSKHFRQFHEEKNAGTKPNVQEFFLGTYNLLLYREDVAKFKREERSKSSKHKEVPTKKVESMLLPYLIINMTDGTLCDLNGKPRTTRILYMCYPEVQQEIYSIEEVSICEYEILVLTSFLCLHPDYRIKEPVYNDIVCHSLENSPKQPGSLVKFESQKKIVNVYNTVDKQTRDVLEESSTEESKIESPSPVQEINVMSPDDPNLSKEFLSGAHCLEGGTGWWKYEFCNGIKVEQFHKEADGTAIFILLGKWNKDAHLDWLNKNPHKRPKKGKRRHISHFYSDGSFCELTGKPRTVEVKFRCKESQYSPNVVSLFLMEPATCEYTLVVESPIMCRLVENADDDGLFDNLLNSADK